MTEETHGIGPDAFSLAGRRALVTGGAAGIGASVAVALARCGADVAVTRHSRPADAVVAAIGAAGRRAAVLDADMAGLDPEGAGRLVAETEAALGGIDILVNNAGIIHRDAAEDFDHAAWRQVLDVNLDAAWLLSQAAGRRMLAAGGGSIVNIASVLSFQGGVRVPAYAAAKHALAGLTKALANEWAGRGVAVNAIAPGYTATENTAALRADPERSRDLLARIPAGRWAEPDDIAGAAVFLASPAASYVHGHVLAVDGGWLAR
ncbi:MAG: SDR family oxidoreductase [Azospirillaceae bacterium]